MLLKVDTLVCYYKPFLMLVNRIGLSREAPDIFSLLPHSAPRFARGYAGHTNYFQAKCGLPTVARRCYPEKSASARCGEATADNLLRRLVEMPGVEPGSKVFMKCLYCCGHSGSPISLRMGKKRKRRIGAFY